MTPAVLTVLRCSARRLAFNPVKKETFQEGINPDGTPHSKWKGYYYTVRARARVWVRVRTRAGARARARVRCMVRLCAK